MPPLKTFDDRMVRGATWRVTLTIKDERGARVSLAGATVYLRVRPDVKAPPVIQLSSPSTGIAISTQAGSTLGQVVATIAPAATIDLATGDYLWDAWVVDAALDHWPVVAPSKLTIIPEVTTLP